jgi:Mg2+-importing ATPase
LDPGEILLGARIAGMSNVELTKVAERTTVFAKLNPAQKEWHTRVADSCSL